MNDPFEGINYNSVCQIVFKLLCVMSIKSSVDNKSGKNHLKSILKMLILQVNNI